MTPRKSPGPSGLGMYPPSRYIPSTGHRGQAAASDSFTDDPESKFSNLRDLEGDRMIREQVRAGNDKTRPVYPLTQPALTPEQADQLRALLADIDEAQRGDTDDR